MTAHPYLAKLERALAREGGLYTRQDILDALERQEMQSFMEGDSLALTRIALYPRAKVVEVLGAVGELDEVRILHDRVLIFASEVGAKVIQAYGRKGWLHDAQRRGWKVIAENYVYQRDVDP
jgi:hypothetical protein